MNQWILFKNTRNMWLGHPSPCPKPNWESAAKNRLEGLLQIDPEKRFSPEMALSQAFLHKEHPSMVHTVHTRPLETEEVVNNSWLLMIFPGVWINEFGFVFAEGIIFRNFLIISAITCRTILSKWIAWNSAVQVHETFQVSPSMKGRKGKWLTSRNCGWTKGFFWILWNQKIGGNDPIWWAYMFQMVFCTT